MFSPACRIGMRDVVGVPLNVFDVSLLQCQPQRKDRGRMVEFGECTVHELCRSSKGFICTQELSKGGRVDSVKHIAARRQAVRQLLGKRYEVWYFTFACMAGTQSINII